MQEAATRHATEVGSLAALEGIQATWVVREHRIKYLRPAFKGDQIGIQTWIAEFRKVRSRRIYRFVNVADFAILAEGETHWIFVNVTTGKPMTVPQHIQDLFTVVADPSEISPAHWD